MIVMQNVGWCQIVLAPSHHQLPLHHPKIPLGILNPIIAKDVQLDLSNITPCLRIDMIVLVVNAV